MSRSRLHALAVTALLLLSCALAGRILHERLTAPVLLPPLPVPPGTARPAPVGKPAAFVPPALDALADLQARPLFAVTRRPPAPPVVKAVMEPVVEEPPPPTIDFTLQGIILLPERRSALLAIEGEERRIWVQEGDEIQGWRVDEVSAAGIRLSQGEFLRDLPLGGADKGGNVATRAPSSLPPNSMTKKPPRK